MQDEGESLKKHGNPILQFKAYGQKSTFPAKRLSLKIPVMLALDSKHISAMMLSIMLFVAICVISYNQQLKK